MGKTFKNLAKYSLEDLVTFGKYSSLSNTWGKIAESDPDYVFWVVANTDKPLEKEVLVAAIKAHQAAKQAKIVAKKSAVDYDRAEYTPEKYNSQTNNLKSALDSMATTMFGDDWYDDVPF